MKRLPQMMDETKNYEIHRKRIQDIMQKTSPIMDIKRQLILHRFFQQRDRSARYSMKEKLQAVEKQNDHILKKIIKVSNRPNQTIRRAHSEGNVGVKNHTHLVNMKKDFSQIATQNQRLAQKIMKSKSSLYQKKMNDAYSRHLKRKEMISKYEFDQMEGQVRLKKARTLQKLSRNKQTITEAPQRGLHNFSRITEQQNEQY